MEIKTTSTRMYSIVALFDMHTGFYRKAIDGVSEEDSQKRLNTKANHMAWIAGSLLQERFELAKLLAGSSLKQKSDELFENHKGIQDNAAYPPLGSFTADWDKIGPILREALCSVTDEKLDSIFQMPDMPGMKMPHFDLITFMTYREANCLGQLVLWRRLLGYEGIKYD